MIELKVNSLERELVKFTYQIKFKKVLTIDFFPIETNSIL